MSRVSFTAEQLTRAGQTRGLSEVRKNWIESQYDAIMSSDPGNYVWRRLRDEARALTSEQLRKWQEQEEPDHPQR